MWVQCRLGNKKLSPLFSTFQREKDDTEDFPLESNWKMIHCVVFREGVRIVGSWTPLHQLGKQSLTSLRKIAFFLMGISKNAINQKSVSR